MKNLNDELKDKNKGRLLGQKMAEFMLEIEDNEEHKTDLRILIAKGQLLDAVDTICGFALLSDGYHEIKKQALEYATMCLAGMQTFIESHPLPENAKTKMDEI